MVFDRWGNPLNQGKFELVWICIIFDRWGNPFLNSCHASVVFRKESSLCVRVVIMGGVLRQNFSPVKKPHEGTLLIA